MKHWTLVLLTMVCVSVALADDAPKDDGPVPAPKNATILFDGKDLSSWVYRKDASPAQWKLLGDGAMEVNGGDIVTKEKFGDFRLHVEFWVPNMPADVKGQGRGNSGIYLQDRYEIQVLDSYGLEAKKDDCGAVYNQKAPDMNACKPPEQWQTYDITFHEAKFDAAGKKIKNAVVTVLQNGQQIQHNVAITGPTGQGAPETPEPGPIRLQDHHNLVRYRDVWIVPLKDNSAQTKAKPAPAGPQKWAEMQYGSLLSATYENRQGSKDYAHKGIEITLSQSPEARVIFDTELLGYSSAWTDGFINFTNVVFDGSHGTMPSPKGKIVWAAKGQHPAISLDGKFDDPRSLPYGPLPAEQWGHYKGLFRHGRDVILSYTVGDCDVLDEPACEEIDGHAVFDRLMEIGPSQKTIWIVLAPDGTTPTTAPSASPNFSAEIDSAIGGDAAGVESLHEQGRYILKISPHTQLKRIVAHVFAPADGLKEKIANPTFDLASLCHGGQANWPETVEKKGAIGAGNGPYVVDTVTVPEENPYKSWMRFGAFDFFSDGRAAICTWSGDVWIVSGIDDKLDHVVWKRYAAGLFQPLGLKIVKDVVYVLGRDQITRLRDLNGDGEADQYENFNNDVFAAESFHEFNFDLQTDSKGYFYFAKAGAVNPGGRGWQRITPHNGSVLRVSPDGKQFEVFATGLRAPNGTSMSPNDEMTVADNQGTWVPVCRLDIVKPGGFLGVPDNSHLSPPPDSFGDPVVWFPYPDVDNSSGGGVWVNSDKWGPFRDRMLHTSYGQCSMFLVMMDHVGDVVQGGVVKFPNLDFDSGIDRARINPIDGQVYLTGLKGWQTRGAKDACFQRVRYTGKVVDMPTSFHVKENGVEIGFTSPVDPQTAGDADSYDVEQWNYVWSQAYGSPEVHVDDPSKQGRSPVKVTEVRVSPDNKSVLLVMPDIQPVMQMKIAMNLNAADGATMNYEIDGTINKVPNWQPKSKSVASPKPATQPTALAK